QILPANAMYLLRSLTDLKIIVFDEVVFFFDPLPLLVVNYPSQLYYIGPLGIIRIGSFPVFGYAGSLRVYKKQIISHRLKLPKKFALIHHYNSSLSLQRIVYKMCLCRKYMYDEKTNLQLSLFVCFARHGKLCGRTDGKYRQSSQSAEP